MGKYKNKYKAKKPNDSVKINSFDIRQNKEKFKILGRNNRGEQGIPGISKHKAESKRKQTLGIEFRNRHKNNVVFDKRQNDNDSNKQFELFMQKKHKSRFGDQTINSYDDVLTHKGRVLGDKGSDFENPDSSEEEDEQLDANFTKQAHFGGGSSKESNKDVINDLILEAKTRKIESIKQKEEIIRETEQLDENYRTLLPQLGKLKNTINYKSSVDDYDKIMRTMVFEPRGEVSDKLSNNEKKYDNENISEYSGNSSLEQMESEDDNDNENESNSTDQNNKFSTVSTKLDSKLNIPDTEEFLSNILKEIDLAHNDDCDFQKIYLQFRDKISYLLKRFKNNSNSTNVFSKFLKERYEKFKSSKEIPDLSTIIILNLILNLYSDPKNEHFLVITTWIFVNQILIENRLNNKQDILKTLFLVSLVSKFLDTHIIFISSFLTRVISVAMGDSTNAVDLISRKFQKKLMKKKIDKEFQIRIVNTSLQLIVDFVKNLKGNKRYYVANQIKNDIEKFKLQKDPAFVENMNKFDTSIKDILEEHLRKKTTLAKPVKCLRLFEPRIDELPPENKTRKRDQEEPTSKVLKKMIKRETKCVERELRRDTEFLNKMNIKQQIQSDMERMEKVKRIFAEASLQQGELNAIQRTKKRK